jgi:hypothetical protein
MRPAAVACLVAVAYVLWGGWYVAHHSVTSLAHVGSRFQRGGGSEAISALSGSATERVGYDGQFYLYIALDPVGARRHLDEPGYRYSRPVYPLAARLLALGRSGLVPWALLALGIAGIAVGTYAVARLFAHDGLSPLYGMLYGAYPGLFLAVSHDLAEALAYGLVALGVLAFGRDGRRLLPAAALFGAAGVTRETTLLFPLALAAWLAWQPGRRRGGALLLACSLAPYVAVKIGLAVWLQSAGAARATHIEPVPFLGLIRQWPWADPHVQQVLAVVAPGLLALAVAWGAVRAFTPGLALLVLNVLVLIVLLPQASYVGYLASGRIATGVVLSFLLCLPAVLGRGRFSQAWVVLALWLSPWYSVLPSALRR